MWNTKGFYLVQTLTDDTASVGVLCLTAEGNSLFSGAGEQGWGHHFSMWFKCGCAGAGSNESTVCAAARVTHVKHA